METMKGIITRRNVTLGGNNFVNINNTRSDASGVNPLKQDKITLRKITNQQQHRKLYVKVKTF